MELRNLLESLSLEDYVIIEYTTRDRMLRFSNNSATVVKEEEVSAVEVYMAKSGRRILGVTSDIRPESLEEFVRSLARSLETSPKAEYAHLPSGPFKYEHNEDVDRELAEVNLAELAERAINSALDAGARRVSGTLAIHLTEISILTSAGADGSDFRTGVEINVRAFSDREASGHGLSVATRLDRFEPELAGRTAGEYSVLARNPRPIEEGRYDVIMGPTVAASMFEHVGHYASAFDVDVGLSIFAEKLGQKVAVESLTLIDHGQIVNGLDSRSFDDEGMPTRDNVIIERGVLKTYLHNSTTAKKFGVESTANAGIIKPRPWNLEVLPGDASMDEMIREVGDGILVTNNWYTRFQSYRTGEFSTIPRDAILRIKDGEIKHAVSGIRLSDSMPRLISSIRLISKERRWIRWWEVETPVLSPAIVVSGMHVTKAT